LRTVDMQAGLDGGVRIRGRRFHRRHLELHVRSLGESRKTKYDRQGDAHWLHDFIYAIHMGKIRFCAAVLLFAITASAQPPAKKAPPTEVAGIPVNYDEARTGDYKLPDPLLLANGKPVRDAKTWTQ